MVTGGGELTYQLIKFVLGTVFKVALDLRGLGGLGGWTGQTFLPRGLPHGNEQTKYPGNLGTIVVCEQRDCHCTCNFDHAYSIYQVLVLVILTATAARNAVSIVHLLIRILAWAIRALVGLFVWAMRTLSGPLSWVMRTMANRKKASPSPNQAVPSPSQAVSSPSQGAKFTEDTLTAEFQSTLTGTVLASRPEVIACLMDAMRSETKKAHVSGILSIGPKRTALIAQRAKKLGMDVTVF